MCPMVGTKRASSIMTTTQNELSELIASNAPSLLIAEPREEFRTLSHDESFVRLVSFCFSAVP